MISKVYISTYLELEAGLPHGAKLEAPTFARLKMTIVRQPVDQFWIAFFTTSRVIKDDVRQVRFFAQNSTFFWSQKMTLKLKKSENVILTCLFPSHKKDFV